MVLYSQLLVTVVHCLLESSGPYYATFLVSSKSLMLAFYLQIDG